MAVVVSTWIDPKALPEKLSSGPEPPDTAETGPPDNFSRVTAAFAVLYARYESALAQSLDLSNLDDPQINRSSVPEITVAFDEEQTTTVVFDVDLLSSLVEIYALRGWDGISKIESALGERWNEAAASPSAGTTLSVWASVVPFFKATRNLIASLVRDALADIERQARSRIESRLTAAEKLIEKAWTSEFRMTAVGEVVLVQGRSFAFGNRALADDVFAAMVPAVEAKTALDRELNRVREEAERLAAQQAEYERNRGAPGYRSPYAEAATPENVERKKEQAASLEAQLRDLMTEIEASLLPNCPLALLALDGLRPGFKQDEMEDAIGVAVDALRRRVQELTAGLAKVVSQVELRFPDDPAKALGDFGKASSIGVENTLLDEVLIRADEATVLPLLSEDTWHDMVQADVIPKGSFSHFVYFHYVKGLLERLDRIAQKKAAVRNTLNMSLAVVSLTTAFVPVLAPVEVALGLFVFCHGIHEVMTQLSRVDKNIARLLLQPGSSVMPGLARIGELETMRREMVRTAARDSLIALVIPVAGQRWLVTKALLLQYSYYTDLQTLYGGLYGSPEIQD